jgi:hypothetical protein
MSRNRFYDKTIIQLKDMFKNETAWNILDNMKTVYEAKDSDYSATGLPMGNLRKCEDAGIEAWRGCLVRIGDKISRLENFLKEKQYLVLSEKALDRLSKKVKVRHEKSLLPISLSHIGISSIPCIGCTIKSSSWYIVFSNI